MITPRSGGFFPRTFDSLRESQFRWFYAALLGQMSSMHMQMVVRGYLVFVLTGSYAARGATAPLATRIRCCAGWIPAQVIWWMLLG